MIDDIVAAVSSKPEDQASSTWTVFIGFDVQGV
jgi:hypothetical protein